LQCGVTNIKKWTRNIVDECVIKNQQGACEMKQNEMREAKVKGNEGKNRWDDRFQIWLMILMV
jgi:hypothetical protein